MTELEARRLWPGDLVYHPERGVGTVEDVDPRSVVCLRFGLIRTSIHVSQMAHMDVVLNLPPRLPL